MGFKKIAAGKTGTTNDKRDSWFIGYTPRTLALTWIGFDDNRPTGLSGSDAAVPMWARYMIAATAGEQDADFPVPSGISFVTVDATSGGLATDLCPRQVVVNEAFKSGAEPAILCPLHAPAPPPMPMTDMFGDPIALDTSFGSTTGVVPPPPPPDSQLGGGVFRTETAVQPPPPPVTNTQPPPTTNPSAPPPSTNTSVPEPQPQPQPPPQPMPQPVPPPTNT